MVGRKGPWRFSLLLALSLIGCSLATSPKHVQENGVQLSAELRDLLGRNQVQPGKGNVSLKIRWPQKVRAYQTAGIPYSTDKIVLTIEQNDSVVKREEITAPPIEGNSGPTYSVCSYELDGGSYSLSIEGRRGDILVAQGNANIEVVVGKSCPVSITLNALNAPSVEAFSEASGEQEYGSLGGIAGDVLSIRGSHFIDQAAPGEKPEVRFNETVVPFADVTLESDSRLSVRVPAKATTGRVVVRVDGIDSTSNTVFWMLRSLSVEVNTPLDDSYCVAKPRFSFRSGETKENYAYSVPGNLKWTISQASSSNGSCLIEKAPGKPFEAWLTLDGFDYTKLARVTPRNLLDEVWRKSPSFINAIPPLPILPDPEFAASASLSVPLRIAPPGEIEWISSVTFAPPINYYEVVTHHAPTIAPDPNDHTLFTVSGREKCTASLVAAPRLGQADVQASMGGLSSAKVPGCALTNLNMSPRCSSLEQRESILSSICGIKVIMTDSANLGLTIGEENE